jgi:hypothetical protein
MMMPGDLSFPPIEIRVGRLVQRSVATLYSHLVTRPTGRAVRLAIESQLAEAGDTAFSLIDLSEVTVLDFSCADEVVAKLLARYVEADRPREAYFVIRGVTELHREPIEVVLERQRLAAVAQREDGGYELLGARTIAEESAWRLVETRGRIEAGEVGDLLPGAEDRSALEALVRMRVVFSEPGSGCIHALSRMAAPSA